MDRSRRYRFARKRGPLRTYVQDAISTAPNAVAYRPPDLARRNGKGSVDECGVWGQSRPGCDRVRDGDHETKRARIALGERGALQSVCSELRLDVNECALDLDVEHLVGTLQQEVRRLEGPWTRRDLETGQPLGMRGRGYCRCDYQLA
jgi:hypothetical protein